MIELILKNIIIALAASALLKYTPGLNASNEKIALFVFIAIVFLLLLNSLFGGLLEGMYTGENALIVGNDLPPEPMCDLPTNMSYDAHDYPSIQEEDEVTTFLKYDHSLPKQMQIHKTDTPGYYLANNGEYSDEGVSLDKLQSLICKSKMENLYEQHNHFKWTPHTHIGKARGYNNWKTFY